MKNTGINKLIPIPVFLMDNDSITWKLNIFKFQGKASSANFDIDLVLSNGEISSPPTKNLHWCHYYSRLDHVNNMKYGAVFL